MLGGGKTWHRLSRLIDVVAFAHTRLGSSVFANYLNRLADPTKHADLLFEFAPVLRLDSSTTMQYEVTGESPRNRNIDWMIKAQDGFTLLLEVKNRESDFITMIDGISPDERTIETAMDYDTDLLFRSIEDKFLSRSPTQISHF